MVPAAPAAMGSAAPVLVAQAAASQAAAGNAVMVPAAPEAAGSAAPVLVAQAAESQAAAGNAGLVPAAPEAEVSAAPVRVAPEAAGNAGLVPVAPEAAESAGLVLVVLGVEKMLIKFFKIHIFVFILAVASLLSSPALAQQPCMKSTTGVICPQPFGGIAANNSGRVLCGPGMCLRDGVGRVKCSATPGGSVGEDNTGRIRCVDGCIDGSSSYCVAPK
jgi:hypothetical protein